MSMLVGVAAALQRWHAPVGKARSELNSQRRRRRLSDQRDTASAGIVRSALQPRHRTVQLDQCRRCIPGKLTKVSGTGFRSQREKGEEECKAFFR